MGFLSNLTRWRRRLYYALAAAILMLAGLQALGYLPPITVLGTAAIAIVTLFIGAVSDDDNTRKFKEIEEKFRYWEKRIRRIPKWKR